MNEYHKLPSTMCKTIAEGNVNTWSCCFKICLFPPGEIILKSALSPGRWQRLNVSRGEVIKMTVSDRHNIGEPVSANRN